MAGVFYVPVLFMVSELITMVQRRCVTMVQRRCETILLAARATRWELRWRLVLSLCEYATWINILVEGGVFYWYQSPGQCDQSCHSVLEYTISNFAIGCIFNTRKRAAHHRRELLHTRRLELDRKL